jgi:alkanesulfonate monooxygenase SsuD/methylene tetrahydromethanopterin reductase-like flavin-dependent oxidoreductase (luciferase family)
LSVAQLVPLAIEAERVGFGSIWTGEFGNDCLAWVQAFGQATQHCRIGSSIVNIYLRHPTVVAAAAAAINALRPGRLVLGLGTSHRPMVEASLGLKLTRPLDYLEEYVHLVRATLTGEPIEFKGQFFEVHDYQLGAQNGEAINVPIFVAALGLTAAARAARYADGVILTLTPTDYERKLVNCVREDAEMAGRDPDRIEIVQIIPCFISDDRLSAQAAARRMICNYTSLPFYASMFGSAGFPQEVANIQTALDSGRTRQAEQAVSEQMLHALAAVGNLADVNETIEQHRQAGATTIALYPNGIDLQNSQTWLDAINRTIDQVASN